MPSNMMLYLDPLWTAKRGLGETLGMGEHLLHVNRGLVVRARRS